MSESKIILISFVFVVAVFFKKAKQMLSSAYRGEIAKIKTQLEESKKIRIESENEVELIKEKYKQEKQKLEDSYKSTVEFAVDFKKNFQDQLVKEKETMLADYKKKISFVEESRLKTFVDDFLRKIFDTSKIHISNLSSNQLEMIDEEEIKNKIH